MDGPVHLHARADQCSLPIILQGRRIVSYQGEQYMMLGFYFARNTNGGRELYYILRMLDGGPAFERLERGLRRHRRGALAAEVLGLDSVGED